MIQRIASFATLLALLAAGCAREEGAGRVSVHEPVLLASMSRATNGAAEIYLTGFVLHSIAGKGDVLIDLTTPQSKGLAILPNLSLLFEHEARLSVRHDFGGKLHDYRVLFGPDPQSDRFTSGSVGGDPAAMNLTVGWALLIGQLPIVQTELVSTSPEGTLMAVRIEAPSGQHYVYNLETSGSQVKVMYRGQTIILPPQTYLVATPRQGTTPTPQPILSGDTFVAHIRARAAVAQFDLQAK
jgi:hypothetical protein